MPTPLLDHPAPAFSRPSTSGGTLNSKDLLGKILILYFYPKDNTPGCTQEGQDFRDTHANFEEQNAVILGVSRDSEKTHSNFKAKHQFPFELLSDKDETLCRAYDVIRKKKMYGKEVVGIERSTFIIDEKGILRREWRKVSVKGHVSEVLEALSEI